MCIFPSRGGPAGPAQGPPTRGSWEGVLARGRFGGVPDQGGPPISHNRINRDMPRRASQARFGGPEGVPSGGPFWGSGGGPWEGLSGGRFWGSRTGGAPGPARPAPRRPRRPAAGPGPAGGGRGGAGGGDGGVPGQSGPRRTRGAPRGVEGRDPPEGMPSLGADRSPETVTRVAEGRQPGPACRPGGDPIGRRASICSSRGTKVLARLTGGQRCRRERHRAKHRRAPTPRTDARVRARRPRQRRCAPACRSAEDGERSETHLGDGGGHLRGPDSSGWVLRGGQRSREAWS